MTKPKIWRLKVKGSLSPDEAQGAVAGWEGTLLRIHNESGETDIYFSSSAVKDSGKKGLTTPNAVSLKEITLDEVAKIR
jgi:hypothetical protein